MKSVISGVSFQLEQRQHLHLTLLCILRIFIARSSNNKFLESKARAHIEFLESTPLPKIDLASVQRQIESLLNPVVAMDRVFTSRDYASELLTMK